MKLYVWSFILVGMMLAMSTNALANQKNGVCVINKASKNQQVLCVAAKSKGRNLERLLYLGEPIGCHTKKDANCEKAIDEIDDFASRDEEPRDEAVVAIAPRDEVAAEPIAAEPITAEPVTAEPIGELIVTEVEFETAGNVNEVGGSFEGVKDTSNFAVTRDAFAAIAR